MRHQNVYHICCKQSCCLSALHEGHGMQVHSAAAAVQEVLPSLSSRRGTGMIVRQRCRATLQSRATSIWCRALEQCWACIVNNGKSCTGRWSACGVDRDPVDSQQQTVHCCSTVKPRSAPPACQCGWEPHVSCKTVPACLAAAPVPKACGTCTLQPYLDCVSEGKVGGQLQVP